MRFQLYQPHANQIPIHASRAKYRVVDAGRRFGKSALGINEGLARILQLRNQIVWIILPLYRQAKEIYWIDPDVTKYFMPLVQHKILKADKSELSLHCYKTNSWLRLKGSDNYDSLRGSGLDLIIWDEAADTKPEAFDTIEPALADSPNHRMLYIGTPKGLNHFHDYALKGDHNQIIPNFGKTIKPHPDWMTWHHTSYDNMTWAEGSLERRMFVKYIDEKRREAEEKGRLGWFNQEWMASFERGAGRFFPTWEYATHVTPQSLRAGKYSYIFETMDWGISAPFCWLAHMLVKESFMGINFNRIYTIAELYGTGKAPSQWATEIIAKRQQFDIQSDSVQKIYVDNTMNNITSDGSLSIVKQFNEAFSMQEGRIYSFEGGSKNRKARWSSMQDWMRLAPDGKPYWIITKDAPNLTRTIPLMEPDETDIDDMNTKLEDHAVDSASFGLPFMQFIDAKISGVESGIIEQPRTTIQEDAAILMEKDDEDRIRDILG